MSRPSPDDISGRISSAASVPDETGERNGRIAQVMLRSRRLSSLTVLYAMSAADCLGLNLSDLMCLGILSASGPVTAGQLASLIGLSTGSVTGLVDRLERLDLVHRERDEQDRRRITIHLNARRAEKISDAFVPMLETGWQHLEQFSDDDLAVLRRYIDGAIDLMRDSTREMRQRERCPVLPPDEGDDAS